MNQVGEFFNEHAADYMSRNHGMRPFHEVTARKIEAGISGDVLCVGGLWVSADIPQDTKIVVLDLSSAMLETWRQRGLNTVQADARELPFTDASFDHVVLPLMLHHVAGNSVKEAQEQGSRVLAEAKRVLRPGGTCWISEFCVGTPVYTLERVLAPVTRRLLALRQMPLVIMHSAHFYQVTLQALDFADITIDAVVAPRSGAWDTITPIIGMPWLRIPRLLYPLTPTLIRARRSG
jgi:SAM-dependent methyltransferase